MSASADLRLAIAADAVLPGEDSARGASAHALRWLDTTTWTYSRLLGASRPVGMTFWTAALRLELADRRNGSWRERFAVDEGGEA